MKTNIECTKVLLSYYVEYTFDKKALACVCKETLDAMTTEMQSMFEELELSRDDVKAAWKMWFDNAAHDGTLISADLNLYGEHDYSHDEIAVIDMLIELACKNIDRL